MSFRWYLGVLPLLLVACVSSGPEPMSQPARYLVAPAPVYPEASRRNHEAGTVTLRVQVKADETLGFIDVKSSSGFARLDAAAVESVKKASFAAAKTASGKRIESVLVVPISFKRN